MHDTSLVNTELDLTGFPCVEHSGRNVERHGADLGVRHQTAWAKDLAQVPTIRMASEKQ
jgi:hypothetical protein